MTNTQNTPKQQNMFTASCADLPLFSGTCQRVTIAPFAPTAAPARQLSLFDLPQTAPSAPAVTVKSLGPLALLNAKFDNTHLKIDGPAHSGAWHRAIEIARALVAAGIWDGFTTYLRLTDPQALHTRLYGFADEPITSLIAGVDYKITDLN